jgi:hypothetical protein
MGPPTKHLNILSCLSRKFMSWVVHSGEDDNNKQWNYPVSCDRKKCVIYTFAANLAHVKETNAGGSTVLQDFAKLHFTYRGFDEFQG